MSLVKRKKINLIEIRCALIALGHEKLWFREPVPKGRNQGVCTILTWDNFVVARRDLDVCTKGWDLTHNASVIFPCPAGSSPNEVTKELDDDSVLYYCMRYDSDLQPASMWEVLNKNGFRLL